MMCIRIQENPSSTVDVSLRYLIGLFLERTSHIRYTFVSISFASVQKIVHRFKNQNETLKMIFYISQYQDTNNEHGNKYNSTLKSCI